MPYSSIFLQEPETLHSPSLAEKRGESPNVNENRPFFYEPVEKVIWAPLGKKKGLRNFSNI